MSDWEIPNVIRNIQLQIINRNSELIRTHSELSFLQTVHLTIKVAKWNIGAGRQWQVLPKFLEKKLCIWNIKNSDNKCFAFCIAAYLLEREAGFSRVKRFQANSAALARGEHVEECKNPSTEEMELQKDDYEIPPSDTLSNPFLLPNKHRNRANCYKPHFKRFGLEKLEYPVKPHSVEAIEDQLHLRINIFSFFDEDGRGRYPMFVSKKEYNREVDLLYRNEHYAIITNFDAFLRYLTNCKNKIWFCKSCFGHHFSKEALGNHKAFCKTINWCKQILFLPDPGTFLKFKNTKFQQACPFVI